MRKSLGLLSAAAVISFLFSPLVGLLQPVPAWAIFFEVMPPETTAVSEEMTVQTPLESSGREFSEWIYSSLNPPFSIEDRFDTECRQFGMQYVQGRVHPE